MPRKLKVYQTSQGFFDLALAAPSMKAALEAWGSTMNLFQQGLASESSDRDVIAAAMAKPGVVLKRPVGSNKPFGEHADLPTASSLDLPRTKAKARPQKSKASKAKKPDPKAERRAAALFEREQEKRERQREKDDLAAAKIRKQRDAEVEKLTTALEKATREHEEKAAALENEVATAQHRAQAEDTRWLKEEARLKAQLRKHKQG
jgi:colicin import membrane protein